jgi:hypothetical protein
MVRSWFIVLLIGYFLAGCAGQPPEEPLDGATSNKDEKTGGETTFSEVERAVLTGILTAVNREPGEKGTVESILVEEPPGADCGEDPDDLGCEKIYFRITAETRVFREQGGQQVETSPGNLEKGQRVRADYTGYPVAESYPAQTTARAVVILEPAPSSPAARVFFPKQRPVPIGYPDSMGRGVLEVDGEGCLRVKATADDPGYVTLWPAAFELDADAAPIQVLNENGKVVARVGRKVVMGGGTVGQETLQENQVLDEQTRRLLFERCPGPYFLAAPEGMHMLRER